MKEDFFSKWGSIILASVFIFFVLLPVCLCLYQDIQCNRLGFNRGCYIPSLEEGYTSCSYTKLNQTEHRYITHCVPVPI